MRALALNWILRAEAERENAHGLVLMVPPCGCGLKLKAKINAGPPEIAAQRGLRAEAEGEDAGLSILFSLIFRRPLRAKG